MQGTGRNRQHLRRCQRPHSTVVVVLALFVVAATLSAFAPVAAAHPAMYGARAMGMGGAFTAVADDATALYWNPAAIGKSTVGANVALGLSGVASLAQLEALGGDPAELADLEFEGTAGAGFLIGASIGSIGLASMIDGDLSVAKGLGPQLDAAANVRTSIGAGIARDVVGSGKDDMLSVRAGVVIRTVEAARAELKIDQLGNETEDQDSGRGYAADLGVLVRLTDVLTVGASARNVIGQTEWESGAMESPTTEFRLGVALQPPLLGGTIAADIASGGEFRYGIEKKLLFGGLVLRFGQIRSEGGSWTTAGAGVALGPVALNTALITSDFKDIGYAIEASLRF